MRIISRVDIKNNFVIKGIQMEGLRKIGDPFNILKKYCDQGADEIILIDIVASLYRRNNLFDVVERAAKEIFVPMTLGGGIKNLDDIQKSFFVGADKVAVNTQAVKDPNFITTIAKKYGSQALVGYIEAKLIGDKKWEVYINSGRDKTGLNAIEWGKKLIDLGIGELMVVSIDKDGTFNGPDYDLISAIAKFCNIPLIVGGGIGTLKHVEKLLDISNPSGIYVSSVLHYNKLKIKDFKKINV